MSEEELLFRLTRAEVEVLNRSQNATRSQKHRDLRFPPYAFTEHGTIMAATILSSPCAIEMSIYVVRAFIQLRDLLASNRQLADFIFPTHPGRGNRFKVAVCDLNDGPRPTKYSGSSSLNRGFRA